MSNPTREAVTTVESGSRQVNNTAKEGMRSVAAKECAMYPTNERKATEVEDEDENTGGQPHDN